MHKVLLVDDEAIIRKGVKNIINWEALGCMVAGEASDGLEGMEKIREIKPDIIVTDIKMPGLNGLDMVQETKALIPMAKIVILTGYRDFEYLQKAIKLGAFEYILKPSKIEDITAVVKRAVSEIQEEKVKQEEIDNLKKSLEEKIPLIKQKLLYDLLFNINQRNKKLKSEMELCNFSVGKFILSIVEITENDKLQYDEKLMYQQGIINSFLDIFSSPFNIEFFILSEYKIVFILQCDNDLKDFQGEVTHRLRELKEMICGCFNIKINTASSSVGEGALAIHEKMREVLKRTETVNSDFYQEDISYDSIKELNKNNEELIKSYNADKPSEAESMKIVIRKALEYMRNNYRETITLNDVAEHTYISACYLSRLFTKELGKSFVEYLSEIRIEKAKEFLKQDNYKTYEVAEMVGIKDAHYFSKLFKKCTGITPSEYKDGL